MESLKISLSDARWLAIQCQGLGNNAFGHEKAGVLKAIEHLGYIQIDTLSVVARAHHHTLWSRVGSYQEKHLNELLEKDKKVFEYWSHAASYLPMSDYRFSLPLKQKYASGKSHWFMQDKKMKKYVLDRIKAEGALQSKDFEHLQRKPGPWYEWKPAKQALEQLFMEGLLMVSKRKGFQKVYDLTERILPSNVVISMPSDKEYVQYLIKKAIASNGLVTENEICYLRKNTKPAVHKSLVELCEKKEIIPIKVEKLDKSIFYTTSQFLKSLKKSITYSSQVHILSPFDNAIIQRKRIEQLFGYSYQIECYLPEPKRTFGYFCLPILIGDQFIGRIDPKADRKTKTFYIRKLHIEFNHKKFEGHLSQFCSTIEHFAHFNGCDKIKIEHASSPTLLKMLRKRFS